MSNYDRSFRRALFVAVVFIVALTLCDWVVRERQHERAAAQAALYPDPSHARPTGGVDVGAGGMVAGTVYVVALADGTRCAVAVGKGIAIDCDWQQRKQGTL